MQMKATTVTRLLIDFVFAYVRTEQFEMTPVTVFMGSSSSNSSSSVTMTMMRLGSSVSDGLDRLISLHKGKIKDIKREKTTRRGKHR